MIIKQLSSGFHVLEDSCIGKWQVETGELCHDKFLVPFACEQIPEGGTVIDCGALCGDHSYAYSQKLGKKGTLIAIEPCEAAFSCLAFNAQAFPSVTICVPCAVSNAHGGVVFHKLNEDNAGASIVDIIKSEGSSEVRTVSIDGLIEDGKIRRLDFCKIDCEGWELKILQGAKKSIEKFQPKLLIEINSARLKDHGTTSLDIYQFLAEIDYRWGVVQPDCKDGDPQFDILAYYVGCMDPVFPGEKRPEGLPVKPEGV